MESKYQLTMKYICDNQTELLELESLLDSKIPLPIMKKNDSVVKCFLLNANQLDNLLCNNNRSLKKSAFVFNTNVYFYYFVDNKFYADINHIISNLTSSLPEYQNIFRSFSKCISNCAWTKSTATDLPILRNLIDLDTAGRIILSCDSEFTDVFKCQCAIYIVSIYFLMCYVVLYCGVHMYLN